MAKGPLKISTSLYNKTQKYLEIEDIVPLKGHICQACHQQHAEWGNTESISSKMGQECPRSLLLSNISHKVIAIQREIHKTW